MAVLNPQASTSEAAIFARLWEGQLTVPLARRVLKMQFDSHDLDRMKHLASRNRAGALTTDEREEFDNFVRVGDLLAILQSKARMVLKASPANRNGHG